ncbi:MAG: FUSC family protein [Peptostreptococcaceae bacterium]
MNKKMIISNTLMFVSIVATVILFSSVFGEKNTLVGVAGITASLSLLGTDYSLNPIKNTIYFVVLEVMLGICAYLTSLNAIIALVVTFIAIFYVLYSFTYNTQKPTYTAFTLGYCFMVYMPVTIDELSLRLLGLVFCGISIMVLQLIINKNRLKKQITYQLKTSLNNIKEEIEILLKGSDSDKKIELNVIAHKTLRNLIETVFEVIDKNNNKLSIDIFQNMFIAQFLNSVNIDLNKTTDFEKSGKMQGLKLILKLLYDIENFIDNKQDINYLLLKINHYIDESNNLEYKSYIEYELNAYASMLRLELEHTLDSDVSEISHKYFMTDFIDNLNSLKNNINKNSLKFTFAMRGALVISLGVFIVSVFNINHGKWLVFSLLSVVQPYLEISKTKGMQRIVGTIIGLIIFEIAFSIVTDNSARTILILIVGYLNNYQINYRNQMVCTTISSLGAAAIGSNIGIIGFERLLFVIIGTLIAIYANRLILPYKVADSTKLTIKKSLDINEKTISILYENGIWVDSLDNDAKTLVNINRLLNQVIDSNNNMINSKAVEEYIYNQHIFMNDIRVLFDLFEEYYDTKANKLRLVYDIDYLTKKNLTKDEILDHIEKLNDKRAQIILINLLQVKENLFIAKVAAREAINSI